MSWSFLRRRLIAPLALLLVAGLAAACGSGGGEAGGNGVSGPWSSVVDAAKKEHELVVYGFTSPSVQAAITAFEAKYGIKVQLVSGRPTDLIARIQSEQRAQKFLGDVYLPNQCSVAGEAKLGMYAPQRELPNFSRLKPEYAKALKASPWGAPFQLNYLALLTNKGLVPEGAFSSWQGLTDPKWKGKLLSDSMSIPGVGSLWFQQTYEVLGADFHKKVAAQEPVVGRQTAANERSVASGEFAAYFPFLYSHSDDVKGLPVRVVVPDEGLPFDLGWAVTLRNAPHINAAQVFINELLSQEFQDTLVKMPYGSVTGPGVDPVKGIGPRNCDAVEKAASDAVSIYGKK
ncbi:ABC transporter substrate-binding protein [Amycolatopsis pigmentata]|uniref:ABC transporter substrate-binding protein n=1 Tax=Amycolatopsis pigmentata TaxID=450801 RepID=A0ABW5G4X8_9PSEU